MKLNDEDRRCEINARRSEMLFQNISIMALARTNNILTKLSFEYVNLSVYCSLPVQSLRFSQVLFIVHSVFVIVYCSQYGYFSYY